MTIHFAGIDIRVNALLRQRCAWCGEILPSLVEVDGNVSQLVEHDVVDELPANTCAASGANG